MVSYGVQGILVFQSKFVLRNNRAYLGMQVLRIADTEITYLMSVFFRNGIHFLRAHVLCYIVQHGRLPGKIPVHFVTVGK